MAHPVPAHKSDLEACARLADLSDEQIAPYVDLLLECLQDLNWPIAFPVAKRLQSLNTELVAPILAILDGDDEVWKYWIVSYFLHQVSADVYQRLTFKLQRMKHQPTQQETEEEVHAEVCTLLQIRRKGLSSTEKR